MSKQTEALKLALEALEGLEALLLSMGLTHLIVYGDAEKAITNLQKELEDKPAQQTIHCKHMHENNGVCPHHNLQCGWPKCNEPEQPAQQEPVAYIRKDQLQKAAQSPMLCEVTPEPRQDRIGIHTFPPSQQQEPVAWAFLNGQYAHIVWGKQRPDDEIHTIPLYASPPAQRKPLTDDEIESINVRLAGNRDLARLFARAIEAAHGIGEKK